MGSERVDGRTDGPAEEEARGIATVRRGHYAQIDPQTLHHETRTNTRHHAQLPPGGVTGLAVL